MDLPPCTLYLHHLRMIENQLALDPDGNPHQDTHSSWTVWMGGVDWTAISLNGLLANTPDPRRPIEKLTYRVTSYVELNNQRMETGEAVLTLSPDVRTFTHLDYQSSEWAHENDAWHEARIRDIAAAAKPARHGLALLWDRPEPWLTQVRKGLVAPERVGNALWGLAGGIGGALIIHHLLPPAH